MGSRACLPLSPGVGAFGGASLSAPVAHHSALAGRPLSQIANGAGWLRALIRHSAFLFILAFLAGCARTAPALKGGKASIPVGAQPSTLSSPLSTSPGLKVPPREAVTSQDIEQPENPAQAASQTRKESEKTTLPLPAGSRITFEGRAGSPLPAADGALGQTRPTKVELAAPSTLTTERTTESGQSIGAAQKDESRELAAKLAAVRPAFWAGLLCVVGSGVLFWRGWWTPGGIAAGTGAGLMLFAHLLADHAVLLAVLALAALAIVIVFRAYDAGRLDRLLPDSLDRFPSGPRATRRSPDPRPQTPSATPA